MFISSRNLFTGHRKSLCKENHIQAKTNIGTDLGYFTVFKIWLDLKSISVKIKFKLEASNYILCNKLIISYL